MKTFAFIVLLSLSGLPRPLLGGEPAKLPPPADLPKQSSVTQYGITWHFEKPAPVGRFVNGDSYVVGPVTVAWIDPKPIFDEEVPATEISERERRVVKNKAFVRHGSMLNPPAKQAMAYDSGIRNFYQSDLRTRIPVNLKPGDCLVSTISLMVGEKSKFSYQGSGGYREHHDDCPIKVAAILTCVAEPLPRDAFRPAYGDREQKIYFARNLKRELLPRLPKPANPPRLDFWTEVFQRPWLNPGFFGFDQPMENMPHYGQWVAQAQSMAGLLLMLDISNAEKEPLLVNMVQVGIDYWGLVRNGHPGWQGWGGHGSGRKFSIVFAGLLLGDATMASPTRSFPKVDFGEDNQTMYGKGWTGARVVFAGHSGIQTSTGKSERPKWGPYEHFHPSEWTQSNYNSEAYRRANTSSSWVGQALVLRLLKGERAWNHDPFFDYVDRWMTEDDREHRQVIMKHWPEAKLTEKDKYGHQGSTWEPFVKTMWTMYRSRAADPSKIP